MRFFQIILIILVSFVLSSCSAERVPNFKNSIDNLFNTLETQVKQDLTIERLSCIYDEMHFFSMCNGKVVLSDGTEFSYLVICSAFKDNISGSDNTFSFSSAANFNGLK